MPFLLETAVNRAYSAGLRNRLANVLQKLVAVIFSSSNMQNTRFPNATDRPVSTQTDDEDDSQLPCWSVYRNWIVYQQVSRANAEISSLAERSNNRRSWHAYRHMFYREYPIPIFCDYRQILMHPRFKGTPQNLQWQPTVNRPLSTASSSSGLSSTTYPPSTSSTIQSRNENVAFFKSDHNNYGPWEGGGLRRRWRPVVDKPSSNNSISSQSFTVCSYNVLCQHTLYETQELYRHCQKRYLQWNHRWKLLKQEFAFINADIFCLQEVEERWLETHFRRFFESKGYKLMYKRRTGDKLDGCAIVWRSDRFRLVSFDEIEFFSPNTLLDRDNVGQLVALAAVNRSSDRAAKETVFIVGNTHLLFNPGRGDIKLCQLVVLLARISRMRRILGGDVSVVLCGDFNSTPFCPLYNLLVTGQLHYVGLRRGEVTGQKKKGGPALQYPLLPTCMNIDESRCRENGDCQTLLRGEPGSMVHDLNLVSAYSHLTESKQEEVSTFPVDCMNVDYIFYNVASKKDRSNGTIELQNGSQEQVEKMLHLKAVLSLPSFTDLRDSVGCLPNNFCGSDHLPLVAEFAIEGPNGDKQTTA